MQTITFFTLIAFAGILTCKTDLTKKKIKNDHLIIIAAAGLLVYIFAFITQKTIPTLQLVNLCAATVIAMLFYLQKLWRAGDAKLFILYSFLMPATGHEDIIPLPCFLLLANSFIFGLVFLAPCLIKSCIHNYKDIFLSMITRKTLKDILRSVMFTFGLSWIIFPVLRQFQIAQNGFLAFLITFLLFQLLFPAMRKLRHPLIIPSIIFSGFIIRIAIYPDFFHWIKLLIYLKTFLLYSLIFIGLHNLIQFVTDSKDRVPFAPILIVGCLSSYTPLITWLMHIMIRR